MELPVIRQALLAIFLSLLSVCSSDKKAESIEVTPATPVVSDAHKITSTAEPGFDTASIHGAAPKNATQIMVINKHLWMSNGVEIYRWPLAGGDGTRLALGVRTAHVYFVPPAIYTVDEADWKLRRHDLTTGKKVVLGKSPKMPITGVFGHNDKLIWATRDSILETPLAGAPISTLVKHVAARQPLYSGADGIIFWDSTGVAIVSPDLAKPRRLVPVSGRVSHLFVHGKRLYWRDAKQIASVPVGGGSASVHVRGLTQPGWFAVGQKRLYWLEVGSQADSRIRAMELVGEQPRTLLRGPLSSGAAVVGNKRLYFTSRSVTHKPTLFSLPLR